jgi:predicted short-subunit dehydrogenase-like oxidoreductase (DUF2520 family)
MKQARWKVAIVGAGKVGSVLGRILADRGTPVTAVVSRSQKSARRCARFIGIKRASTLLEDIPSDTTMVLITTPHGAIGEVALALSRLEHLQFRRLSVCHASGMLTAEALAPLAARGATVFSFHPLQTFPRDFEPAEIVGSIRGIFYGVDGTRRGVLTARRLAGLLEGRIIEVPIDLREFYHAACVLASNHLTAMLSVLETMYARMHATQKEFFPVFKPIIMATLGNIELTSPADALSGPVARGGTETIAKHFEAIRRNAPELLRYFSALTEETVNLALRKGSISPDQAEELMQIARSHEPSQLRENR